MRKATRCCVAGSKTKIMIWVINLFSVNIGKRSRRLFFLLCSLVAISPAAKAQDGIMNQASLLAQFTTVEAGVYRVTYEDLLDVGIDLFDLNHRLFGLASDGQQVAIRTVGKLGAKKRRSKLFGPGGYIEFYAEQADNLYTAKKAFTLLYNSGRIQIPKIKRKEHRVKRKESKMLATQGASIYRQKLVIEENRHYDFLSPSQTDPWHFGQVTARGVETVFGMPLQIELPNIAGDSAHLKVELYGLIDTNRQGNDHLVTSYLNGLQLADEQFDGQIKHSISIENAPVNSGINDFNFAVQAVNGAPVSSVALNRLTVTYPRQAIAQEGFLEGGFDGGVLRIDGFDKTDIISAYRRDSSGNLSYLRRLSRFGAAVLVDTNGIPAEYIFVSERALIKPSIMPVPKALDIVSGEAEYLIISHSSFIGSEIDRLVQLREQKYSVKVVTVEQIYAQFSDQIPDANAIHQYIRLAAENLGTRFVALIGADSYDYKQYQQYGEPVPSLVPTLYRSAQAGILYSNHVQSDAAYGDLNNDHIPDIPIGRFPVKTTQELGTLISKLEKFENSSPFTFSTLIADTGFSDDANIWIDSLPDGTRIKGQMQNVNQEKFRAYSDDDGAVNANADILQTLNLGVVVVNYFGHGSMSQLGSTTPPLLRASDADFLHNSESPFMMLLWGSWTGSFANPDSNNNLMYRLLVENMAGAASLTGLSTISSRVNVNRLSRELNQRLYQAITLGEAVIQAKTALANNFADDSSDVILGMQIMGDPALVVNWWPN